MGLFVWRYNNLTKLFLLWTSKIAFENFHSEAKDSFKKLTTKKKVIFYLDASFRNKKLIRSTSEIYGRNSKS